MKRLILAFAAWTISAITSADESPLPIRTIENVADGIIVTYQFNNPIIRPNKMAPGTFSWEYKSLGVNDILGEPAVPFRTDMFYIPAGHRTQIVLLDATYKDTTLVISPAFSNPADDGSAIAIDSIRPYEGFFPNSILKCDTLQNYRGIGLQNITIIPIQYNYTQHKIRAYKKIKYKISFIHDNVISESKKRKNSRISDITSTFLSKITLNYTPSAIRSNSTWHNEPNEQNYVIITTDEYNHAIQDFVEWKRTKGYNIYTIMHPAGSWTTESVIEIAEAFLDNMNVHCLLIVGGYNDIPAIPFTYSYLDSNFELKTVNAVTDYNYGLPTSTGIPQIFRGRIPADNAHQVATILNKIIQYEKNPIINEEFYHTGLHCAEFQDRNQDGYEDRCFVMTSENIRNHMNTQGYQVYRQYVKTSNEDRLYWSTTFSDGSYLPAELQPDSFLWNGNSSDIMSYINNGVLYALHRDHGESDGWYHPPFKTQDVNQLQNGNKLPIIFSLNCRTGKYNETEDCFTEAFLKNTNGGCVGIFAATEISFSGYNDAMALGMFDAIWPNLQPIYFFTNYSNYSDTPMPTYELGQILDQGLIRMGETYGLNRAMKLVTWKLFHCFGDPAMRIYTETPQYFAEPLIFSRGDSIFVFVEDGDCNITFYDKLTEEVKSYKGNYAAYANPSDSLVICLDRHNYVPYIWDYSKDVYIQNENIQGETRIYTGNTIYVGNHVTVTKTEGDVNIQNSNITIHGKQLELHPGTQIDKNFIFLNR